MAKKPENPFLLQGYEGKEYFCDRREELKFLKSAMSNKRNVSIISLRRIGKTALIRHLFATQRTFIPVFIDIYRTVDQKELIIKLVEETMGQVGKPTGSMVQKAASFFKSIELSLTFDQLTGIPKMSAALRPGEKEVLALTELFNYLEIQKKPVVIALDEFQQIIDYPEKNTEALLREHVQRLNNVNFIFCGSNKRMLQAIFSDNKRPFYQATEPLYLDKIAQQEYTTFIHERFHKAKRKISKELIIAGLEWCRNHTYFVQYLFNRLFSTGSWTIIEKELLETQVKILKE